MTSLTVPPKHTDWIVDKGEKITTSEGKEVIILELDHTDDEVILSGWAKHFRDQYCDDSQIDLLRAGTSHSRSSYLKEIKFPDETQGLGPSIRSGDFGEILVADYLQYRLGFWVPRTRYRSKTIRDESTKGSDILGFKFIESDKSSPQDTLAIFESKTQFTGRAAENKLQEAVTHSIKDQMRKAESLNAIKQRFLDNGDAREVEKVQRFQDSVGNPYKEISGAAALFATPLFDADLLKATATSEHPNSKQLVLLVIKGIDMMKLVHELYRRAANEA